MPISSLYSFLRDLLVRNPDGTGNNLLHRDWGSAGHEFVRVTPNSYLDGKGQMEVSPSPRLISNTIMAQPKGSDGKDLDIPNAAGLNEFHQFFGQFLTHDIAEAPLGPNGVDPPLFLEGLPFPFNRTPFEEVGGVRQQHNEETSFLDLSAVYGRNATILNLLRDDIVVNGKTVQSAKLLTSGNADNLLPTFAQVAADSGKTVDEVRFIINGTAPGAFDPNQYVAGDNRANQNAALLTHQTMWAREHNWQVERLAEKFPTWSQNQLFEAARTITEAEWQHVVYSEYLPKLLGTKALSAYKGYKSTVDPSVINEWTTVAFRFGHDQSSNVFKTLGEDGSALASFTLGQSFALANTAQAIRTSGSMDEWVRGQLSHYTQELDGKVVDGNRNALFGIPGATVDLNVFDIQRARDHGVGNYNKLREGLGLATYASFEEFAAANGLDTNTLDALKSVYTAGIGTMDSLVGGLLEKNHRDSQLGETFTRLTVMQFERLRDGDRFYYENRLKLSPDVLQDVKSTSLADIIARTSGVKYVYHDAFAAHERIGGTSGSETLNGTQKADLIFGLEGNDTSSGGAGNDDLHGDQGDDKLDGGTGRDLLKGGLGTDWLDAGADKDEDRFVFDTALGAGNVDTIKNFTNRDKICLDKSVFTALGKEGTLSKAAFHVSKTAALAGARDDRIIYQEKTGNLYYDPDGTGAGQAQQFAKLDPKVVLNNLDFVVIS
ncbi:peroxidase family protein [Microvirga lenta]|uniref:peroxidase family protein n=1 Tax=Microvirga lenta TaxID=2881337 RepID=UPI001CFFE3FB|nr:peroxidase family protein [Microvirga lenta]MCB5176113.1 hypothetical protein [Microvirga lenta]